jgi:periplasmic copper chaperone A
MKSVLHFLSSLVLCQSALAHVSLESPRAEAGSDYRAVLRVGHGCDNAATTAITVQVPAAMTLARAAPKSDWDVTTSAGSIRWTAKREGLGPHDKGEFALAGKLADKPGPLWFKVRQQCGQASMDWADVPAQGTSTEGMKTPAVLLDVMSPADFAAYKMLPVVEGAWVRAAVPGQQATGAFMRITAKQPMQLVGATTSVAGIADVHEMKMEGDVMHMRPAGAIELPAGKTVELKPGGYHLMLQDLKKPLENGSTVPVTLVFRDTRGKESRLELKLPVALQAPGAPAAGMPMEHKH